MKKITLLLLLISSSIISQTTIKGKVLDDNNRILGANITLEGLSGGTVSDFNGFFTLTIDEAPPPTLIVSAIGFESSSAYISDQNADVTIILKEGTELAEVVILASRTPERIFESPVSIERYDSKEIKNTASADFYGGLENLKGIDINTNSLTFISINTRGSADFANSRFVQLVDGMDNTAPA
mgnify:CR=1 FL=1